MFSEIVPDLRDDQLGRGILILREDAAKRVDDAVASRFLKCRRRAFFLFLKIIHTEHDFRELLGAHLPEWLLSERAGGFTQAVIEDEEKFIRFEVNAVCEIVELGISILVEKIRFVAHGNEFETPIFPYDQSAKHTDLGKMDREEIGFLLRDPAEKRDLSVRRHLVP